MVDRLRHYPQNRRALCELTFNCDSKDYVKYVIVKR